MEQTREGQDSGLACLVILAHLQDLPANPSLLRHQFGAPGKPFSSTEILRAAKSLGLKAREVQSDWPRLTKTHLPAIAIHNDGHFFILAQIKDDKALVQDPLQQRPLTLTSRPKKGTDLFIG